MVALAAALAWPGAGLVLAQDIESLGAFGDWRAYAYDEKGEKACYIASQPKKDEGDYKRRGEIYAMVTHRPADKVRDEVSLAAGYRYKSETRVEVLIDGKTFELLPHEDTAWVPDSAGDRNGRIILAPLRFRHRAAAIRAACRTSGFGCEK